MKYTGGKQQLAKHIVPFIHEALKDSNGHYFEPFVGGGNLFQFVEAPVKLGSDVDCEVIDLLSYLQKGTNGLPYITKDLYNLVKKYPNQYPPYMVAYVSICGSFQGKKWGGYAGAKQYKSAYHDYPQEALNNLVKQSRLMQKTGGSLICQNYDTLEIPPNSVIYCDPPYVNTTGYKSGNFDHVKFWDWVREISLHSKVFVSEYNYPDDFKPVWQKERKSTTGLVKAQTKVESLVIYQG